jgi:hypothetical protein
MFISDIYYIRCHSSVATLPFPRALYHALQQEMSRAHIASRVYVSFEYKSLTYHNILEVYNRYETDTK